MGRIHIALHTPDGWKTPNLALLKLSAFHKAKGDEVSIFMPLMIYDQIYSSKVFTYSQNDNYLPDHALKGGIGYGCVASLPDEIEHTCPDYDLLGMDYSLGFLTRGCIRTCPWCVVPQKEGKIRAHADIEEFCRHKQVKIMDNNILAHDHGIEQIEKMARMGVKVDFNQGLDARLIDRQIAQRLGKLRWIRHLRLACDHKSQMEDVAHAVKLLREAGGSYREYWCYVLVLDDVEDAEERVNFLTSLGVTPFAQPYRDREGTPPTQEQKDFANWCNLHTVRNTCTFKEFKPRKAV